MGLDRLLRDRHVVETPDIERDEIRALYVRKGFEGPLLDRVVETICARPDVWVAVMAGSMRRSAASLAAIGTTSAIAGYALGALLGET